MRTKEEAQRMRAERSYSRRKANLERRLEALHKRKGDTSRQEEHAREQLKRLQAQ